MFFLTTQSAIQLIQASREGANLPGQDLARDIWILNGNGKGNKYRCGLTEDSLCMNLRPQ